MAERFYTEDRMYRLKLNDEQYQRFKKMAKIEMMIHDITFRDLAKKTNYPIQSIRNFFCKRNSKFIAYAIAEALNMEVTDYEA
jgi:hypothetical protein